MASRGRKSQSPTGEGRAERHMADILDLLEQLRKLHCHYCLSLSKPVSPEGRAVTPGDQEPGNPTPQLL
jgi:hypothetical protein